MVPKLRKVDQKYLKSSEISCWRRMEKISWVDRVRNEALHRVKKERNTLRTIKRRKANWIRHILRRNYPLNHIIEGKIEGKIEVMDRRERSRRHLLNDINETEGTVNKKRRH